MAYNMTETKIALLGIATFIPLIVGLLYAIYAFVDGFVNGEKKLRDKQLTVGKEYLMCHDKEGWIHAVYFGKTLDGYRHFYDLGNGKGMQYKSESVRFLFSSNWIKETPNLPLPEREFDKKAKEHGQETK